MISRKVKYIALGFAGLCLLVLDIGILFFSVHHPGQAHFYNILPPVLLVPWIAGLGGIFALTIKSHMTDHRDIDAILVIAAVFPILGISAHGVLDGFDAVSEWFMMSSSIASSFSMMRAWLCITPPRPFEPSI